MGHRNAHILITSYRSTETEKKKYREAIQSLSQARKLNTKRVKNAREGRRRPDFFDATGKLTLSGYPHMEHEFKVELQKAFERFLDNEAEKEEEESRILLMTEEKKRQEAEEETRKKIEQEAIKEYLEKAAKAEAEVQKKRDELKKKLRERPGLTQQQIEFIVEDVHPTNHNHAALLMQVAQGSEEQPTKAPMATSTTIESNNASFQKVSRTLSFRYLEIPCLAT
jgi:myosin heavy subunit